MKNLTIISVTICVLAFFAATSHARIGESLKQCDARYGKVTFKNVEGNFEYRSYVIAGKTVRVVFFRGESLIEMIVSGPYTRFQSNELKESMQFFVGLLTDAYEFTEEQMKSLAEIKRIEPKAAMSVATKGNLRATYRLDEAAQDEVTITAGIVKLNVDTGGQDVALFFGHSFALNMKSLRNARANGF